MRTALSGHRSDTLKMRRARFTRLSQYALGPRNSGGLSTSRKSDRPNSAVPKVAAIVLQGRPIAFWLTVFPATDNSQGSTPHHLYGCELDLAAPASCARTALIASTDFSGDGVAQEPVAAAAFPDGSGFAIAHTDTTGHSWLHVANLSCADPRAAP